MSNTLLTPSVITKEALMILHQKLRFVGSINRNYDDQYAQEGAKIGSTLKIRLPNKYTVRTGDVMSVQDITESSVDLTVATKKGVDMSFTATDLTLTIDQFSKRYIQPAMSVLAAAIEADALTMIDDVYNASSGIGSAVTSGVVLDGQRILTDNLAPEDMRTALLNTRDEVDLVDTLKTLFQSSAEIAEQYREGRMGSALGLDFMRTTHLNRHTPGSEVASAVAGSASTSTITIGAANQTGATLTITNGSSKTLLKGDVIVLPGVNRVHPETKVDTGLPQQFVVTASITSSGTSVGISPSIITSGALQNVTASPTNGAKIGKLGTADTAYGQSLLYHRDAFALATADLIMPQGVDFKSSQTLDGIRMRIVRQYDINNDRLPCRLDVLYGFKTVRPELACKVLAR